MLLSVVGQQTSLASTSQQSFLFGKFTANTRIEPWWAYLRKTYSHFYMNFFKDLMDSGLFDNSNDLQVELVRFCFLGLIQKELYNAEIVWNLHRIRKNNKADCPSGIPEVLFLNKPNFKTEVDYESLEFLEKELTVKKTNIWCSQI